jgi:EAL and modified HD-GYP domain-containing signal transduction protein
VCVTRHPILDRTRTVFGYDLRFQALSKDDAPRTADDGTARMISEGLLAIGLDTLIDGRKAFVNVGRHLLLEGIPSVLPANRVVIELSADIEADAEVIDACRQLKDSGYALAIDNFALNEWTADLVPLASYLKVDLAALAGSNRPAGMSFPVPCIAKGVETLDAFERASKDGCQYFQGFFFGRPLMLQGKGVPGQKMANLRLLHALNNPDLSVHHLEELIKHDAALCYRILRTVNSAAYATQRNVNIQTIREALVLLGRDTVRRWASLWALGGLNESAHSELIVMSTVRARACELLGSRWGDDAAAEGFLAGMCSLLDAVLERPMEAVLADLPFDGHARAALMGNDNAIRRMLDSVIAYEKGELVQCAAIAERDRLALSAIAAAFADALKWSRELPKEA